MARPELDRGGQESALDPPPDRRREVVLGRDRDAAGQRESPVCLHDPERHEQPRDGRPVVDPPERIRHPPERLGPMDRLVRHRLPDDEPRDEVALRPDEGGDLRPDADPGRRDGRGVLHLPGDAQEVGVVAGQPDDPALVRAVRVDPEVPVGDPAGQRRQGQASPGDLRDPLQGPTSSSCSGPRRIGVVGH